MIVWTNECGCTVAIVIVALCVWGGVRRMNELMNEWMTVVVVMTMNPPVYRLTIALPPHSHVSTNIVSIILS